MRVGAHISASGGYRKMAAYVAEVGCECQQIFAKSPRQWRTAPLKEEALAELAAVRAEGALGPLFTHTSYLINLTTDNDELREKSTVALADELVRGSLLGAVGVNTHLGSVPDGDRAAATLRAARAIERAFELAGGADAVHTALILENTAGAGTLFGGSVADIAALITELDLPRERTGFCIDTCHAWAEGYDVATPAGWEPIVTAIDTVGLDRWLLIHGNDCKFGRGEHKDRHEWIGKGFIGEGCFAHLLHREDLAHVCLVTEMPGEAPEKDIVNLAVLKQLRDA